MIEALAARRAAMRDVLLAHLRNKREVVLEQLREAQRQRRDGRSTSLNAPLPLEVTREAAGARLRQRREPATKSPAAGAAPGRRDRGRGAVRPADRGRYATDASIYQVMPVGVFVPQERRGCARSRWTSAAT